TPPIVEAFSLTGRHQRADRVQLARHRSEGIAEDVTRDTLADVGRKHARYGAAAVLPWLLSLLRGDVVSAGRLQVERRAGADGHALHVPETGPLHPEAVDAALDRARALTGADGFSCTSWLLDPVLREQLPETNIARFAERFRLVREAADPEAGSRSAAQFVFVRPLSEVLDPAVVVPVTRLERLVALRLRDGSGWREPVGVLTPR
ncbi:hypothetical protein, partial [Microbacterium marinilacus]|uniref:hypothetical protein n=1 Tax=Microbacterium marinilacus TaxID=415209 RepID=UPI0031E45353